MKKIINRQNIIELIVLFLACVIYAISTVEIIPVPLIPGSFIGIAVAMNKVLGTSTGLVNFLLNMPVLLLCLKIFKPKLFVYSCVVITSTSVLIDAFTPYLPGFVYDMNPLLVVVTGGLLMGVAAGIILEDQATMAGTSALSRVIQLKFPRVTVGTLMMVMDTMIVLTGAFIIKSWLAVPYSVVYTICYSVVIDLIHWIHVKMSRKDVQSDPLSRKDVQVDA